MLAAGVRGFKCFTCYSGLPEFPAVTADDVRKAMEVLKVRILRFGSKLAVLTGRTLEHRQSNHLSRRNRVLQSPL